VPLYDYQCKQCQKVTEVRHGFQDAYAEPCPHCGGPLARVFNPAGIVFKGSGFYITDSRKGGSSESSAPAAAPAAAPTESKKSDAA
jgi:putative FmdB family regulatory protein